MSNLLVLLAVLCLLGACKGNSHYEPINNSDSVAMSSTADSVATDSNQPKLVKTAEMNMKVKDIHKTSERIVALTEGYHGMVMHHHMQSTIERSNDISRSDDSLMRVSSFTTTANLTVKVPSDSLEHFMTRVGKLGLYVNVRKMDVEDMTLAYLSNKLKLESRSEIIAQQKQGKIIIKKPADVLALKDDMIDQKVSNLQTDDAVRNSIVDLTLYQSNTIVKEVIANDDPDTYRAPFMSRFAFAFTNGWNLFVDLFIGLANLWVFLLLGLGAWFTYKWYKRRQRATLSHI
ncbi:DUF4349 domain-containing protein [Mucilaginibacter lacusdianchii]|uniref:DUF4349 domain-containing protein n=1 Tax=Mucilaginibacter lacusdianchii TaxID=2684211 RepID=UPI00131B2501|nr:DUF4349 domain-containing protein [Mucilaginibacter sp. JXJ CY 39]